ncbi:hypothetical protein V1527DRAFT_62850 [Lipomyces starkeyi]
MHLSHHRSRLHLTTLLVRVHRLLTLRQWSWIMRLQFGLRLSESLLTALTVIVVVFAECIAVSKQKCWHSWRTQVCLVIIIWLILQLSGMATNSP